MEMGEITEAQVQILYQDAEFLNCLKIGTDLLQTQDIEVTNGAPPSIFCPGAGFLDVVFCARQDSLGLLNRGQLGIELGDEAISLGQCEYTLMLFLIVVMRHGLPPRSLPLFSTALFCAATVGVGAYS